MKNVGGDFWGEGYVYGIDGDGLTGVHLSPDSSNCMYSFLFVNNTSVK